MKVVIKSPRGCESVVGMCAGSAVFSPGNPVGPIHGWEEVRFLPRTELWEAVWVPSCVVVKPWCCRVVGSGICPTSVLV